MGEEKKEEQAVEETQVEETTEKSLEDMEKSWNDSKSIVLDLLGDAPETESEPEETQKSSPDKDDELSKAKGKDKKGDMEYEEEEDDEDEEAEDKEAKKSLEDSMDDEAQQAMNVEPFLRQLVKGIDEKFDRTNKAIAKLGKAIEFSTDLVKATARMSATYGELQKGMAETVEKIGNTPVKSGSVLSKAGGDRFGNEETTKSSTEETAELNLTKDEILEKALKLRAAGKLEVRDVTKIENRVRKGIDLPSHIVKIFNANMEVE